MGKKKKLIQAKLIANPGAGTTKDPSARLEEVTRLLLDRGIDVDVALAKPKERAEPIARKAVKEGYKLVIAMGGDGTIEAVARGLVGSKTRLGIIPAGTANNVGKSLGIPEEMGAACDLIRDNHVRKLDVGRVKTKEYGEFYFFELVAVGLTAALYPAAKKIPKGKLTAMKETAETLLSFKAPKVYLTLDGDSKIDLQSLLVTVSNTPAWGMNFLVAPNASLRDGKLDISVYPDFNKVELLAHFAKIANVNETPDDRVQRYRVSKIKIKSKPEMQVMSDGEMIGCTTAKIRILPKALRVIAPEGDPGLAQKPDSVKEDLPLPVSPVSEDRLAQERDQKVKAEDNADQKKAVAEEKKEETGNQL